MVVIMLTLLKILLLIIMPPISVMLHCGFAPQFWINLILTLFGYIPGLIHGIWILTSNKCDI